MSITQLAIEKNRITSVFLIIIFLGGLVAYSNLPQDEDPGFTIRVALVMTYFPGASPERVEQLVTDKLEKVIQEIPELDNVASTSKTGVSEVYVTIKEKYKDMRPIWDNLRRKVDKVKPDLPDGIIGPIVNDEFGDVFGIIITLTGEGYNYAELKEVADEVRDEFLQLPDAAKVEIAGVQDESIFIEYNNTRLSELGLSPVTLQNILESQNIINPGGDVKIGDNRIALEPLGSFESVEMLRKTLISLPGSGEIVPLGDIATITRGYDDPPSSMTRSSNDPALTISISMREGGNIVELGKQVDEVYKRLQTVYPIGIEFDIVAFQPEIVSEKVDDFVGNLLQAIAIVSLVMLFSLGIRTGLVVATLIPMAMLLTFLLMNIFSMQLDQVSLASLIIALGMLVDNAIVMTESIMVQTSEGKKAVQAAIDSAKELRFPLLTSSLTTAAAFLPFFLAKSMVGEYVSDLFIVVTITLLSSWILAITMIPMFASRFLKVKSVHREEKYDTEFYKVYRKILSFMLYRKGLTVLSVFLLFILTMFASVLVPNIFFPDSDKKMITAEIELPMGTAIERTEEVIKEIDQFIEFELSVGDERQEGVVNWASFIGSGAPKFNLGYSPKQRAPEYGLLIINCSSFENSKEVIDRLSEFCYNNYPEIVPTIRPLATGPPVDNPIEVRVFGKDPEVLFDLVNEIKNKLTETKKIKNLKDNWGLRTQKLLVRIDEARTKRAGLTNQDVAISLQTLLSGFTTTQYREEDKVIPVVMRTVAEDRENIDKIESLNIYSLRTGKSVPFRQVADIELVWEPSKILRRNRFKAVTISSGLLPGNNAIAIVEELDKWLSIESMNWPIGYSYEYGGELESSGEANQSIADQFPIAGFLIILLLVMQFNSIRKPLIILITIPLGIIGVYIGLIIFDSYFGFMTLLGVVSLAGIVINNAIVLLERIKIEIETNGFSPQRAVIEAAQRRMRPILLTTATTVGGLIPLYLGGGPMWEPMAIAIMCGLAFATTLTLGIVPVLYSIFYKVRFKDYSYDKDVSTAATQ